MKIKKMFAALLSAAMVVTMLPGTVIAADGETDAGSESVVADTTTVSEDDDVAAYLDGELTGSDGRYSVTVTFDTDAQIPEGSAVSVKELSESDEAYQEAEEQAEPEEEEQFAALDISILDADGNEIEPASAVQVEIEVSGLEGVSEDTAVTVSHINESTGFPAVEAVADTADATDGVVSFTDEATVKAAFTVDSFSTFTITWDKNSLSDQVADDQVADEAGNSSSNKESNDNSLTDQIVDETNLFSNNEGSRSTGDTGTTTEVNVNTSKTAELNDDGTYDLTLSITGDQGSESEQVAVDVLFIIDRSSSMWDSYGGIGNNRNDTRMKVLQKAVERLVTQIEENNNIDARYSAVQFGTGSVNKVLQGWVESGRTLINTVNGISYQYNVGTNYQAGIRLAKQQLQYVRSGASTYVIFISDGEPTYSYNSLTGNTETSNGGGSTMNQNDYAYAIQEISSLTCDCFYAIGVGSNFNEDVLAALCGEKNNYNPNGKYGGVNATYTGVYSATNTSDLEDAFDEILAKITFFAASNVTISDPLSNYAEMVLVDGSPQFTIKVTNGTTTWTSEEGKSLLTFKDANGTDITLTASYNSSTRIITLNFPDDYELEEGYTYSISTVVTASEAAVTAGADGYDGTGGTGTGTHASEKGFYSNGDAEVTYTANGKKGSTEFPKPVIQLQYFYVYHSSVQGGNISKIAIASLKDGTYDITDEVSDGYLYGGYYEDYKGKGGYVDNGAEVENDENAVAYDGTNVAWVKDEAFGENGKTMIPVAGETYYLKEVPDEYLNPGVYVVYDTINNNTITQLYLMTAVDDCNYKYVGFDVTNKTAMDDTADEKIQLATGTLYNEITVTKEGTAEDCESGDICVSKTNSDSGDESEGGDTEAKVTHVHQMLKASDFFDVADGYLAISENLPDYIAKNATYTQTPYFVTLDGVKVTAAQKMKVYLRNVTYQGWKLPGIYKTVTSIPSKTEVFKED